MHPTDQPPSDNPGTHPVSWSSTAGTLPPTLAEVVRVVLQIGHYEPPTVSATESDNLYVVGMRDPVRNAALGGVIGPAGFISAWVIGAAATSLPYSSIDDAISRLAAVGSDTRLLMTAGFVTFGLSLPVYAWALRATVPGRAWITATATGLATLAVAAAPLDRSGPIDRLHSIFAGIGYLTLAATPLLASRPLRAMGHQRLARFGVAAGLTSAGALAVTTTGLPTGLFQRVGLTVSDAWIIATALTIRRGARSVF